MSRDRRQANKPGLQIRNGRRSSRQAGSRQRAMEYSSQSRHSFKFSGVIFQQGVLALDGPTLSMARGWMASMASPFWHSNRASVVLRISFNCSAPANRRKRERERERRRERTRSQGVGASRRSRLVPGVKRRWRSDVSYQ